MSLSLNGISSLFLELWKVQVCKCGIPNHYVCVLVCVYVCVCVKVSIGQCINSQVICKGTQIKKNIRAKINIKKNSKS